ncbi:hypothetical protein H04402_02808 [Clostridium botulinum H04402 065]|nr:hypothetical protein [Clostridium botulinum]CBZ04612.1 hypothetical protein H04402_02808 [Clostridium botulinum H04402 065]
MNNEFFYKVIKYLKSKNKLKRKKNAFYEHITIADDTIEALNNKDIML